MMAQVGLRPEHYRRYPHMFSGGQRQRIAVARALMLHPRLVVADEPVSALDVSIQAQVLNLLMDLQQELGIAYLFISHNLQVVAHIADDGAGDVPRQGRRVRRRRRRCSPRRAHPYTRALLASTPTLDAAARRDARSCCTGELPSPLDPPSGCAFHKRCPHAIARCAAEVPAAAVRRHPRRLPSRGTESPSLRARGRVRVPRSLSWRAVDSGRQTRRGEEKANGPRPEVRC